MERNNYTAAEFCSNCGLLKTARRRNYADNPCGGEKKRRRRRETMRQLSVRRAAGRSGDIIRPQSRSMNFTPLLSARQITSRTTRNPRVFGQYPEKSSDARHIRRARLSPQDVPLHNVSGFIQVVPLISEQEKGTRAKAHLASIQDVDTHSRPKTKCGSTTRRP